MCMFLDYYIPLGNSCHCLNYSINNFHFIRNFIKIARTTFCSKRHTFIEETLLTHGSKWVPSKSYRIKKRCNYKSETVSIAKTNEKLKNKWSSEYILQICKCIYKYSKLNLVNIIDKKTINISCLLIELYMRGEFW